MAKKRSSKKKTMEESSEAEEKKEAPQEEEAAPVEEKPKKSSKKGKKKKKEPETEPSEEKAEEAAPVDEKPKKSSKKGGKKKKKQAEEEPVEEESPESEEAKELTPEDVPPVPSGEKKEPEEEAPAKAIDEEDEYAITILGWATAGYDTTALEKSMARGDPKKFRKDYEKFEKGIKRIEEIKREIETLNIAGVEKDVDKLLELLKDPMHVRKAENYLDHVKKLIHAKDLEIELDSMMVLESLKERAMELKEDLKDPDNIDDVEEAMKDLRREFKEEYALNQFMELIDEKPREVKKIKVVEEVRKTANPMVVKDLFVFTSKGKFLGHKTARKGAIDKKELIARLNEAREIVRNERISPGMSLKIPKGEETLLVHKGPHISIGLIISGQPHKLAANLLKKGVEMMEREDADAISKWDSMKKPTLPHMKKNMKAIMYAAMKLGDEMKA